MAQSRKGEASRRSATDTRVSQSAEGLAPGSLEIPALTVVAHPDFRRVGERVTLAELNSAGAVELSRTSPLFAQPGSATVRPLDVAYLSRRPLRLVPSPEGVVILERAGSPTPATVDGEGLGERRRLEAADLARGVVIELGGRVVLLLERQPLVGLVETTPRFGLVGDSAAMVRLRREIERAAGVAAPVILRGASGSGKELVARAIHDAGPRRDRPWLAVNVAAIPASLAAAELFGAVKGAYTGAERRKEGFFLAADGGTLFLDEIGDTPLEVQPLLLRALESGEIQPVGSAETRRVDVRVIAATDVDLEARTVDGRFRASLLHRLAGYEIRVPSLAERRSDVGRLLVCFLERELAGTEAALSLPGADGRPWPPAALVARLARYDWPGNVRELANVARRLAIARRSGGEVALGVESILESPQPATDGRLTRRPYPEGRLTRRPYPEVSQPASAEPGPAAARSPTGRWRPVYRKGSEVSEDELVGALRAHGFGPKAAAEALGISRAKLYQLIESCPRVRKAADLAAEEIERALAGAGGDLVAAAGALEVSLQGLKMRCNALGLRPVRS